MLNIIDVHKTFNKGTVNEKKALDGIDLHQSGGFCDCDRRQRGRQVNDAEHDRRRISH